MIIKVWYILLKLEQRNDGNNMYHSVVSGM